MTTPQHPAIVKRAPQLYVSVGGTVAMDQVSAIADRLPDVFEAIARPGLAPSSAPFLRYRAIDMNHGLQIEACVPIDAPLSADDAVSIDTLPGGRFVVSTHRGHFNGLRDATARLLSWGSGQGLLWDTTPRDDGEVWAGRIEIYETDPSANPTRRIG